MLHSKIFQPVHPQEKLSTPHAVKMWFKRYVIIDLCWELSFQTSGQPIYAPTSYFQKTNIISSFKQNLFDRNPVKYHTYQTIY